MSFSSGFFTYGSKFFIAWVFSERFNNETSNKKFEALG